jgi:uncharacterized protein YndB with AHSA1/START domain
MKQEPFTIERTFNASIKKVWKALPDTHEMKEWYFDIASFEPQSGFELEFIAGTPQKSYFHKCQVTEVIPGKKLSYRWRYDGYPGNSLVTFKLFEEGNQTRLRLTHEGIDSFPNHLADFAKESFAEGWTHIVGISLKNFVEKQTL